MAYADLNSRSPKLPSIAAVAAVHALIGYAFISGLAYDFIKEVTPVFVVKNIPLDPPPPPIPPEPQQRVKTKEIAREKVTAVTPVIGDVFDLDRVTVIPDAALNARVDDPIVSPLPPEPVPGKAAGVRVKGNRAAWITTDDYPSSAIRAEEEGTVTITVRIGADGRVGACTVSGSSGHPALDAATCRLYPRRARFTPALDRSGTAVEASYVDRIRWQLPRD